LIRRRSRFIFSRCLTTARKRSKPATTRGGFGYSVGFLVVILGRQQLFTENTLTGDPAPSAEARSAHLWQRVAAIAHAEYIGSGEDEAA
jgi:formate/nitrite transporter FocA (FNT family)